MNKSVKEIIEHNRILIEQIKEKNEILFRYREAMEESIHELFVGNSYEGDEVKDLVMDILNKALEDENE